MTTQSKTKKPSLAKLEAVIKAALASPEHRLSKIIAITNQKGGVGKTSTSFNFAHYLNELGYRVLAVDLDGQGNFTELFFDQSVLTQYVHTPALALFEQGGCDNFQPLTHPSGIDVLATPRNCHELNEIDSRSISVAEVFFNNLSAIAQHYDFVLCDTPPAPGVRTTSACASADYIFAPVLVDTFADSALEGVISSIQNIGMMLEADLSLTGILINQLVLDGTADTAQQYKNLAARIGSALIPTPIRQTKPFSRAQRKGIPVWHLRQSGSERSTSHETRQAYGEMAARIPEIQAERIAFFNEVSRAVRAKIAAEATAV
ncbi:ParA family protein [Pseudomonas aeruginosa]|jgi:chromosome partitioning protein|uniref:Cobyrinic acid ac-diamide synthase n=1 Tax=Ectopseudomonas oleovorans TaxID=301 RepID=A0A379PJT5_ECTOL|nr:ParA family protein [Pseudomonas oleovorans]ELQ8317785.1 ParA family protein [Pseudomonas aeruginosa]EPL61655.1 putative partitioning protein [Stutzerimonas stutzeri B1SMN1]MBI6904516.1 ParA family protein [Pseudomonas aeruginosa]OWK42861.1 Sporulation initiation inhibitor protein Soj [Pseudomonas oleovorans subsp. oleovorans]SEJ53462.1 chromosome partitioning protein [Pseudomonas oleovorans]